MSARQPSELLAHEDEGVDRWSPSETEPPPPPSRGLSHKRAAPSPSREAITRILAGADIVIGGERPHDIEVHDERFYDRVLEQGALGLGESYIEGFWDCPRLDEAIARGLRFDLERKVSRDWRTLMLFLRAKISNMQSPFRAGMVAAAHYDLGNDFFEKLLGPSMVYSCAYWKEAEDLDSAQRNKLALICDKLGIGPGDRVLDIGCGWGAFARYAAGQRGAEVVGITVSPPQAEYARSFCAGLPVEVLLLDYRDSALRKRQRFDKIVSVGMFEHVGKKNYGTFMQTARDLLKDDGLFLLQTIGRRRSTDEIDVFTDKHIFPNGIAPSPTDVIRAFEPRFVLEDWHAFGADYERTLLAWCENFERFASSPGFDLGQRFYRTWKYYLLSFAGAFKVRNHLQLWQIVLSREGTRGSYRAAR
jgi:cyclopropane-fatty-acyl-phospholipid synthase